jgi:hypothetical protein
VQVATSIRSLAITRSIRYCDIDAVSESVLTTMVTRGHRRARYSAA